VRSLCPWNVGYDSLCECDIILALDQSGSIDSFRSMLDFAIEIVRSLLIGPDATQIGVFKFSVRTNIDLGFHLNEYHNQAQMIQAINGLIHDGGDTDIASALEYARDNMFLPAEGARAGAVRVLFLVSDGGHNVNTHLTIPQAKDTKDAGIEIFTIGATSGVDVDLMKEIASDPDDSHYHDIGKPIRQILADVCRPPCTVSTTTGTPPTTMTQPPGKFTYRVGQLK